MNGSITLKLRRILNLIARIGLFTLILILATMVAPMTDETEGLALADLSGASVRAMDTSAYGDVLYAGLTGGPQPAGIYRSDDNGHTWQLISSGPGHPGEMNHAGTGGSRPKISTLMFS